MDSIPAFTAFFTRFQQFICRDDQETLAGLSGFFNRVRSEWRRRKEAIHQERLLQAPSFNVFRVLHLERRESSLHTPMLGHLLDPTASHGQGLVFLRAFLNGLRERHGVDLPDTDAGRWTVRTEVGIGLHGRLDLLIENRLKKIVLVIENKVDTHDHQHQLRRYMDWMHEHRADWSWTLIYLTPDGRCPKQKCACRCLSYGKDVLGFLKTGLLEVTAPPVKETVEQYCDLITSWVEPLNEEPC